MKNLFVAVMALLLPVMASAQLSISGKVTNQFGEALPGATVTILNPQQSTVTDATGKYSFNDLEKGNYTVKASYIGYQSLVKNAVLNTNLALNFSLGSGTLNAG
ncbi:carboxypeptidase-like regulatory domain-containing protein [Mucilaginibacter sp. UC70_90]